MRKLLLILFPMLSLFLLFSGCSGSASPPIASYNSKLNTKIDQLHWNRVIQVEEQVEATYSGWTVPNDGKIISQKSRIRRYDSYVCGYTKINNVNIPQYCESPVYDQYYTYTIKEWQVTRTVKTSGGFRDEIVWGNVTLKDGEREGQRIETFSFSTEIGKDSPECSVKSKSDWDSLNTEMTVLVEYNTKTRECRFLSVPSRASNPSASNTSK